MSCTPQYPAASCLLTTIPASILHTTALRNLPPPNSSLVHETSDSPAIDLVKRKKKGGQSRKGLEAVALEYRRGSVQMQISLRLTCVYWKMLHSAIDDPYFVGSRSSRLVFPKVSYPSGRELVFYLGAIPGKPRQTTVMTRAGGLKKSKISHR